MKQYYRLLSLLTVSFVLVAGVGAQTNTVAYQKEINEWDAHRVAELKADDGWLNLVGLFWLDEGKNTFGSGDKNVVVFPAGSIDESAGYFQRAGNTVKLVAETSTPVLVGGKPVKEAVIFNTDMRNIPEVSFGSLRWSVIMRGDKIGIRVRDLKSPVPAAFKGIERFPANMALIIPAKLHAPETPGSIAITNKIGQTTQQNTPGKLVFNINKRQYSLDALDDGDSLLIVFGDATNGKTTYPSGRFITVRKPGADGLTVIDFNKAYNPPCAFTDFATCPLPPSQNILPLAIKAGEKKYGHH